MSDDPARAGNDPGDDDDDNSGLSDDDIWQALQGFEHELGNQDSDDSAPTDANQGAATPAEDDTDDNALGALDTLGDFNDELQGLLGDKAKAAMILTRLTSAELLAAFCQVTDIAAQCVAGELGAVAVLRNLEADAPERAARELTTIVSGLVVVLAVNRADKLEATMYTHGEAGQSFVPPVLFASTASYVEDLMLGISTMDDLRQSGLHTVDSADYDHQLAMQVIARYTQMGRSADDLD